MTGIAQRRQEGRLTGHRGEAPGSSSHVIRAFCLSSFEPRQKSEATRHGRLLWPDRSAAVVTVGAFDRLLVPELALWIPAGRPITVHPARGPGLRTIAVECPGFEPTWLGVGSLLRELLCYLAGLPPGAPRRRAELAVADAADPVCEHRLSLPDVTDPALRTIQQSVRAHPALPHAVEEWARQLGVSSRTLSRRATAQTGLTFGQWRTLLRVHLSLYRLVAGAAVATVAREVGYESTGAFIVAFRQLLGTNPGSVLANR
ncbi:MAG: helix-turn-helix domain-containing protein [Pseudonocardiaceae bacterium]|nr:helix-turn-helix domain-containing protein [Pseudonocardiaceae bacterium]